LFGRFGSPPHNRAVVNPKSIRTLVKPNLSHRKSLVQPRAMVAAATTGEIPRYVTPEEVALAREKCVSGRDRVLLGFLWVTGARISEALALRVSDINTRNQTVQLQTLKRRRKTFRVLPIPGEYFAELLALIMDEQNYYRRENDLPIFNLSRSQAFVNIRHALRMALVDHKRARPHALRHGHAMHAVNNGVPLPIVQRTLGHSNLMTTSIYLQATAEDVRREYGAFKW
jgi:integrase/recombinase XerD